MKRCKWAGDAGDEYCKDCNGVSLMYEGQEKVATDCAGYEPGEEDVADVDNSQESEQELPINKPETDEVKNTESEPKKETKTKTSKKSDTVKTKKKQKVEKPVEVEDTKTTEISTQFETSRVSSIRVMSGVTRCINDTYYKFTYESEITINENATQEQIEADKEKLWVIANTEVDAQLSEVLK